MSLLQKFRKPTLSIAARGISAGVVILLSLSVAHGASPVVQREIMDDSLGISITPRGQKYFVDHFVDILEANGYAVDGGQIKTWKYVAAEPIVLNNLSINYNDVKTTLADLRDLIQKWLGSFQLGNPLLTVLVNGIHYQAKFSHFGLRIDPASTKKLAKANSVIADLEIEIPKLELGADEFRVNDANNTILGEMGLNAFQATELKSTDPKNGKATDLKFRIPLEVSFDPVSGVSVEALDVQTNLQMINVDWSYSRPLILPDIELGVTVNGKSITQSGAPMKVNYAPFEDEINLRKQDLAKALQVYLRDYLAMNGTSMINSVLEENSFTKVLEDINLIDPLGVPTNITQPATLQWGLIPKSLGLENGNLSFKLNAFVEDPDAKGSVPLMTEGRATAEAVFDGMSEENYDVALCLNEAFINRMLQLSSNRGYFKNMTSNGDTFSLNEIPYFIVDSSLKDPSLAKMHISMDYVYISDGSMLDKIEAKVAVHNPVKISFDMITKIKMEPGTGDISFIEQGIDPDSIKLDPSSVRSGMFYDKVLIAAKAKLDVIGKNMGVKQESLAPPFSLLPKEMIGIPLKLISFQSDPHGYFDAYVEYGAQQ